MLGRPKMLPIGTQTRRSDLVEPTARAEILKCLAGTAPWPLVLLGEPGVGKTCAAMCVLDLARDGRVYRTVSGACGELIEAGKGTLYAGEYPVSVNQWWTRWEAAGVVCLDELGDRSVISDHTYGVVKRAIDAREGRPAIFISNLDMAGLDRLYDRRITSRLAGGTVIVLTGPDRRTQGKAGK